MITPLFRLDQNDKHVILVARTPYVNAQEAEMDVTRNGFKMHVKPYFLSLVFKQPLCEGEPEKASWDVDKNELTVLLPKKNFAQHFDNLDTISELLTKPRRAPPLAQDRGLIEVVEPGHAERRGGCVTEEEESEEDEEYDWDLPQKVPEPTAADALLKRVRYGFNKAFSGVFEHRADMAAEILDLPEPDSTPAQSRRTLRLQSENAKMEEDCEHYLADTFDNEEAIAHFLAFQCPWELDDETLLRENTASSAACEGSGDARQVTEEQEVEYGLIDQKDETMERKWSGVLRAAEREVLQKLPRGREYLLGSHEKKAALVALVDILYGFVYDFRTTEGDPSCESPWTLGKLSSTFSWLDPPESVADACKGCVRRALAYPLYRTFPLARRCLEDVAIILSRGRRSVLRALISIRALFADGHRYLFNTLFVDDYLCWIQSLSDVSACKKLDLLASKIRREIQGFDKQATGWNLDALEEAALAEADAMHPTDSVNSHQTDLDVAQAAARGRDSASPDGEIAEDDSSSEESSSSETCSESSSSSEDGNDEARESRQSNIFLDVPEEPADTSAQDLPSLMQEIATLGINRRTPEDAAAESESDSGAKQVGGKQREVQWSDERSKRMLSRSGAGMVVPDATSGPVVSSSGQAGEVVKEWGGCVDRSSGPGRAALESVRAPLVEVLGEEASSENIEDRRRKK